jgi:hypothetical protein
MADQDKHNKSTEELDEMDLSVNGALLKELFESIDITIDRTNDAKTNISSLQSDVATNNAKTGITTSQANAITANTAKTGITTAQASAITANTAKTGITTTQASAITSNTTNITKANNTLKIGQFSEVPTSQSGKGVTARVTLYINLSTINTIQFNVTLSNGTRYQGSTRITAVKS